MNPDTSIRITRATEHNLRSVSVVIPGNKLTVVTGVSGSGKSSLVFDVLYREAESSYLGSFSSFARQFMGKMKKPEVEKIEGLSPAIALNQKSVVSNPRSTVGTITGIYDLLRLLFARTGTPPAGGDHVKLSRSLFSFNSPEGACPACKGLGVEDFLDPELLVDDENLTLRQGALVITAPNGYIIYSQVTMDVLSQVCQAEGFSVDTPWKALTPEQKHIVLYGSDKILIPFGKHPLESRMKWSGITAKPREMGYYKGILPVMEAILQRDRNKNILRFVRTGNCRACRGQRLNDRALSVRVGGSTIAEWAALQVNELKERLQVTRFTGQSAVIAEPVVAQVSKQAGLLERLGLSYLSCDRDSTTLSGGESQRLRLASLAGTGLSGMTCIFDEPSIGLHSRDMHQLITVLKDLRDKGNTVIVVEHEEEFMWQADWLIDIGPGPGTLGGEVLFSGEPGQVAQLPEPVIRRSRTLSFLLGRERIVPPGPPRRGQNFLRVEGAAAFNLKNINVAFMLRALNVVTGVSGAGKSTLTNHILAAFLKNKLLGTNEAVGSFKAITGWEGIGKIIAVDQSPIGRTPRSNPATYTGLFDNIRDLFSSLPESVMRGYEKSRFSFNTPGGRCETCQGAGYQAVGMHFMGNVEVLCESCEGSRFDHETLEVTYKGKNISGILGMTVSEAAAFFAGEPKILRHLETLQALGLGYITLGQRSSTLSGGEAQRIKLAAELVKPAAPHTLYILDEPTTGLHQADIAVLLKAVDGLILQGHTVIMIEHHAGIISAADHITDLGPGSGKEGGQLLFSGSPEDLVHCGNSFTARALAEYRNRDFIAGPDTRSCRIVGESPAAGWMELSGSPNSIIFKGVTTHNLRHIDVEIPRNRITVITGVSGSGKSSLAFDTLFAEGQTRFLESYSPYVRSRIGISEKAEFEEVTGLTPAFAVGQGSAGQNPRSTVGTMTGLYDHYRLLFSRIGRNGKSSGMVNTPSSLFSFNHKQGACPRCDGLGSQTVCDPMKLIRHPDLPIPAGAMEGSATGKFYGDPFGQYMAALSAVGRKHGFDPLQPWQDLPAGVQDIILGGTGNEQYEITWQFKRGERTGEHLFNGPWKGLLNLVQEEYNRKHADHRGEQMMEIMKTIPCEACGGSRLNAEALGYRVSGKTVADIAAMPVHAAIGFFDTLSSAIADTDGHDVAGPLIREIMKKLSVIGQLGLSYLSADRGAHTLSGGESQRIRLASQLGSAMTGITYVLDEPTIGLHPRDTAKLMKLIRSLQAAGNTVVIVEHDREVILAADHVIDMGPGAGINGGKVLAVGSPAEIMKNPMSVTAPFLSVQPGGKLLYDAPCEPAKHSEQTGLSIRNAFANNLKGFDLDLPASGIIAVTGVSGSGKSTLLYDVIWASRENGKATGCSSIAGLDHYHRVVRVEQRTGFTSPLATPATFTGIFDRVREIFAATGGARKAGFTKNHFSFVNKAGQCPVCQGTGQVHVSMDFLADITMVCEQCAGNRYRPEVLECIYKEFDIAGVMRMTVAEAARFFSDHGQLASQLGMLEKVGLGYLQLGQPLDTLSGGESQRLILAAELMKPAKGNALYLLEEPSTGLHFLDIACLVKLFHQLAALGHTLLVIEHDPDIVEQAGYVVELGPEGGEKGGFLIQNSPRRA